MATLFGHAQEVSRAGSAQCRCSRKPCSDLLYLAHVARRRARRQICTGHRSVRCDRYARFAPGDSERERRHQKSARRAGEFSVHERSYLVVRFRHRCERDWRPRVYLCFRARFRSSPEGLGDQCRYRRGSTADGSPPKLPFALWLAISPAHKPTQKKRDNCSRKGYASGRTSAFQ